MAENMVITQTGSINENWFAAVAKIGHPSASICILKYDTSIITFLTSHLRQEKYQARQACTFLSDEDVKAAFWATIGMISELPYSDPLFRNVVDTERVKLKLPLLDDMGSVQARRIYNIFLSEKPLKKELSYFATVATKRYMEYFDIRNAHNERIPKDI